MYSVRACQPHNKKYTMLEKNTRIYIMLLYEYINN